MRANFLPTLDSSQFYQQVLCETDAASGFVFNIGNYYEVCGSGSSMEVDSGSSPVASAFVTTCATACATGNYWACVGRVNWPSPKASTCTVGYTVTNVAGNAPVSGAPVEVCAPTDFADCGAPLGSGTTDQNGSVALTVANKPDGAEHGLNGFMHITSPDFVTANNYWGFPLVEASFPVLAGGVITPVDLQVAYAESVGAAPDPTLGTLFIAVLDCRFQSAPEVQVTLSPPGARTQGFSPTTFTPATTTDSSGIIVFGYVPAGFTTITATPLALGRPSSQVTVNVVAGTTSLVEMPPTPSP